MKTIQKEYNVYTFDELTQEAKDKARYKYNENNDYYYLIDDLRELRDTLLTENKIKDISDTGKSRIFYSLSYSQGDGVMFEGVFEWNGYTVTVKHSGHYYHYNSKTFDIVDEDGNEPETNEPLNAFNEIYIDICKQLEKAGYAHIEYEYSEECFSERCIANEYTFLEDGTMFNI